MLDTDTLQATMPPPHGVLHFALRPAEESSVDRCGTLGLLNSTPGMIRKLLSKLKDAPKVEESTLAGRQVLGTAGLIRDNPDYDDAWYYALAARHPCIMDVGANRGFTALVALLAGNPETMRLLLVDANPEALGVACQNVTMNGYGKGITFQRGLVSEAVGNEIAFFTVGPGDAGSVYASHAKTAARKQQSMKLTTTTVDALSEIHDFQPDLVKIDVEGAELDVLKGAVTVAKSAAKFFIEMHDIEERKMAVSAQAVIDWAAANGRTAYYMKEHTPLTDAQMIAHRGRCHLLIIPSSEEYPTYLKPIAQRAPITTDLAKD
ncbi:MAG: FkbM family methyltransferase [Verrucomicrobiales bacterium]|jgi:FkbM family methyltransferase